MLSSQRTQKRGRFCCPHWRRRNDKRKFLHWRNRLLPRRSTLPERRSASCNTMPPGRHCGKPNTTKKSMCKASPTEKIFCRIIVATSRSANANFATCGSCWGSGPSSANGRGIATSVAAPWCSCPTGESCGPVTNFSVPNSQEGGLRSSDGTRGVVVDGRPSRGHDCCTHGQEHNRSCAHLESDHGRNQEPPSRIGACVHGHQHGAVRGSKEARTTTKNGCVAPGWARLRIQVLPDCADSGEVCRALALLQLLSRQTRSHWFVPTRAGTCCPDSVQVPSQFRLLVQSSEAK